MCVLENDNYSSSEDDVDDDNVGKRALNDEEGEDEGKDSNKKVNERDTKIKNEWLQSLFRDDVEIKEKPFTYQQRRKKESNKVTQGRYY